MSVRHLVLIAFKPETPPATRSSLEAAFAELPRLIDGISSFEWGTNVSPEGLNKNLSHAFVATFVDAAARDAYLPHPAHLAFVEQLKPWLSDVVVLDYSV
jgi:quinol monooxygenase YgiN